MEPTGASKLIYVNKQFDLQTMTGQKNFQLVEFWPGSKKVLYLCFTTSKNMVKLALPSKKVYSPYAF